MLRYMEEMVFATEPRKIFINIGTNDISRPDYRVEKLMENYGKIIAMIQKRLPGAQIYMMAYYPVNEVDKLPEGSGQKECSPPVPMRISAWPTRRWKSWRGDGLPLH